MMFMKTSTLMKEVLSTCCQVSGHFRANRSHFHINKVQKGNKWKTENKPRNQTYLSAKLVVQFRTVQTIMV